jgi:hypothetical protein
MTIITLNSTTWDSARASYSLMVIMARSAGLGGGSLASLGRPTHVLSPRSINIASYPVLVCGVTAYPRTLGLIGGKDKSWTPERQTLF